MATRLRRITLGSALPWGLAALSLLLAFAQGDGRTYTDTRVELTAEPGLFLDRVASVWSPTVDLGHIQSGQYVGYLFPMGPWFAGLDALGVPAWIAERLWFALVLWLAGLGRRAPARRALRPPAGAVARAWPRCSSWPTPTSSCRPTGPRASLLAYAALPWILLAAHRGLREPRGLALAGGGGAGLRREQRGTNAATVFWIALAPAALLLYEVVVLRAEPARRAGRSPGARRCWRAGLGMVDRARRCRRREGPDFLALHRAAKRDLVDDQPVRVPAPDGLLAVLLRHRVRRRRAAGLDGGAPYLTNEVGDRRDLRACRCWPSAASCSTRRWRYAPFFGLLAVGALLVMSAGYPAGKPAAGRCEAVYYHFQAASSCAPRTRRVRSSRSRWPARRRRGGAAARARARV